MGVNQRLRVTPSWTPPLLHVFTCFCAALLSFSLFSSVCDGKSSFSAKKLISTSEWRAEHPFAGWNIQHIKFSWLFISHKKKFIFLVWVIVLNTKLITFYNPIPLWLCKYWWQISITHTHLSLFLTTQTRISIQHDRKLINVFILSWLFSMSSFDFFLFKDL